MGDDFEVIGRIVVDSSGAVSIQEMNEALDATETAAEGASTAMGALGGVATVAIGAFTALAAGVMNAVSALGDFINSSIDAGRHQQDVMAQLDNVLRNAGNSAYDSSLKMRQYNAAGSDMVYVTEGSSKEIAKVGKELDRAKESLDRSVASYDSHTKHTQASAVSLNQHQQKVAELTDKYDALTKKVLVNRDALMDTGGVYNQNAAALTMSRDRLEDYADWLSKTTTFGKDQQIQAETMMLQFDKIGQETFPGAMRAAEDLATRMGVDLPNAALTIGRALGDPAMGVGRLNQQFKLFEPQQLKMIENLAKMGKTAEAQTMILDALNNRIGGSAAAAAQTYDGQLQILNNTFDDLKATLGEAIIPMFQGVIDAIMPLVNSAMPAVTNFIKTQLAPAFQTVGGIIGDIVKIVGAVATEFVKDWGQAGSAVSGAWGQVKPALDQIKAGLDGFFSTLTDTGDPDGAAKGALKHRIKKELDVGDITPDEAQKMQPEKYVPPDFGTRMQTAIEKFGPQISDGFSKLLVAAAQVIAETGWTILSAGFSAIWRGISNWINTQAHNIGVLISGWVDSMATEVATWWVTLGIKFDQLWANIKGWIQNVDTLLPSQIGAWLLTFELQVGAWWDSLKTNFNGLVSNISNFFRSEGVTEFINGLKDMIATAPRAFSDAWSKFVGNLSSLVSNIGNFFRSEGKGNILGGLKDALTDAWNWVSGPGIKLATDAFNSLVGVVSGVFGPIADAIVNAVIDGLESLVAGLAYAPGGSLVVGSLDAALEHMRRNKKASGGAVLGGEPYLVGERGPELYIPRNSGTIVNNQRTNTIMNYYFGAPQYRPQNSLTGDLAQAFRKS